MTSASDRVQVIAPGQTYVGKQGFTYGASTARKAGAILQVARTPA
jgi:hypothetical protein